MESYTPSGRDSEVPSRIRQAPSPPGTDGFGEPDWPSEGGGGGPLVADRGRRPIPPKLYRIGEVVDYSGVSRQTIHNYTIMGLLKESRWTTGGHRLYDESVFGRLDEIADLKGRHKSLQEIRDHFAAMDGRTPSTEEPLG